MGIPVTESEVRRAACDGGGVHGIARLAAWAQEHGATLLIMLVGLAWLLPGMFGRAPWKPDEAYTVAVINHFYHSHDWLVPMLGGQPFMEKPPLFYWTATGFAWLLHPLLGLNAAARFATLFYMLVTLVFVWLLARELYGRSVARLAPLVLLSCLGFLYRGHELFTDIGLLAGFALAWYGMALCLRRPLAGAVLLGLGTGLGFMCKGLIAPGILGLIFLCLPLLLREYRTRRWWLTAGVALLVALPWLLVWPILLYQQAPAQFHDWFWDNNLGRFLGWNGMGGAFHDRWYYAKQLPWMCFPAWPLALYAVWRQRGNWRTPAVVLPAFSALLIIVVLQVSRSTNDVYALPLLLPLAALGALGVTLLPKPGARFLYWSAWLLFGVVASLLWWGWIAALTGRPMWLSAEFSRWIPTGSVDFQIWALVIALLYSAAWLYLGLRTQLSGERMLLHWTLGIALVWCLTMSLWLPALNAAKSYAPVMTALRKAIPARYNCIVTQGVGDSERGMLDYYDSVNSTPSWIKGALQSCELMLVENDKPAAAATAGWQLLWQGARNDDRGEHFWLLARVAPPATLPLARIAGGPYVEHHHPRQHLHGPRIHDRHSHPRDPF
ncbi:MAG: glycosyltransferase family 39 protein [Gammaproteobacteria bacterium]|nr:glycosyltransferase family 39 protein [Gammaproteobacteria bacterium]MBU6509953.1 glycosyltransferase family 39 protein [Gammaproteobacteria bacterium]MDE1983276.1 glycosyltransferase family 39 protein [Gammaproteobacteria bacterium]MDE2108057.1 glycosyltransferase family 39 protein [Gammaproteobacteria bacterium]MDE2460980.1 glycosyltransferase family 39 protein [Gammaproteobacteria bacterium]